MCGGRGEGEMLDSATLWEEMGATLSRLVQLDTLATFECV